jgi:hypothetical protein
MVATLFLTGCLPSLNPVYTDRDLVFDPGVVGLWKQPKSKASWEFTKRDDKSYNLVYTDEEGHSGRFIARLARVDETLFLDLFPQEVQDEGSGFYKFHLVPIHTIYVVRRTTPDVELAAIDYEWLEGFLTEHPGSIPHATFNGRRLITASTQELQAFVLQHKDAFKTKFSLQRGSANTNG